jgi:three-Cys-motif partner protein
MDTIWPIEPHTLAKHEILRRYLGAWFPILKRMNPAGLNYIDGFAGPGVYERGEVGSPVIAIRTAVEHILPMPGIWFGFIEKDEARAESLEGVLQTSLPDLPANFEFEVFNGEFADVMEGILDDFDSEGKTLAPTFVFVDPFGYAGFPMELIERLLEPRASEILVTFMASRLRRFLDEFHENAIDELFGFADWREARDLSGDERTRFLLNLYKERLLQTTPAKHVFTFEMVGRDGNTIYWLIFATKHVRGCEVMKEAMWGVDPQGTFRFFDAAAGVRTFILDEGDPEWARQAQEFLWNSFRGQVVRVDRLQRVIAPTPFLWRKRKILLPLEESGRIAEVTGRRRARTYPKGCWIRFSA